MFVDSAVVHCIAGNGGNGCNSFRHISPARHPKPTGGDGGCGGCVIFAASRRVHTLLDLQMRKTVRAPHGKHGGRENMAGADAADEAVEVPPGTEIYDLSSGLLVRDLVAEGDQVLVAEGGAGGKGNHRRAAAMPGEPGESRVVRLELKLIADVGLVGFPNAGKSTFISRVSSAKSKIAAYPFTTKEPVLGVVRSDDRSIVVADIPGLIEGAHRGRGLGHRFLRHVERTRLFLHLVDLAASDGRDPASDYSVVNRELERFSPAFAAKPRIVAANKMDVPEAAGNLVKFRGTVSAEVFEISAATGRGVPELVRHLFARLAALEENL